MAELHPKTMQVELEDDMDTTAMKPAAVKASALHCVVVIESLVAAPVTCYPAPKQCIFINAGVSMCAIGVSFRGESRLRGRGGGWGRARRDVVEVASDGACHDNDHGDGHHYGHDDWEGARVVRTFNLEPVGQCRGREGQGAGISSEGTEGRGGEPTGNP